MKPGPREAALVILGLEESVAIAVLRNMPEDKLRRILEATKRMGVVSGEDVNPALEAFTKGMGETIAIGEGAQVIRKLVSTAVGQEKAELLALPPRDTPDPLLVIRSARAQTLADLLAEEQPQIAAAIMSQLPRDRASQVLDAMPAEIQADILQRIAQLKEIPTQMLNLASEALAQALAQLGGIGDTGTQRAFNGVSFAAGMLNELTPASSDRLLGTIEQTAEQLAPKIREAMFTFEDAAELGVRALQLVMKDVDAGQLLLALKTASEEIRERFLAALSSRAASSMREDLALLPPTKLSDVEKAQREIVECTMRLATEGKITLPKYGTEKLV